MLDYLKKKFYQWIPAPLQQQIKAFILFYWGRACLWIPIYRIEKAGLSITLIGRKSQDPYITDLLYGEYLEGKKIGFTAIWNINKTIQYWESKSDIILFRDHGFQPSGTLAQRLLTIPYYITQETKLPDKNSELSPAFRDPSTVSNLKKIQKAGFKYYVSHDSAQLESFYHTMYRPFIQDRHQDSARIPSWSSFKRIHENMELLLISKDDQPVAGALNLHTDDRYTGYANGVLNADPLLLKQGVASAIYWFGMVEAHRRGCRAVNLGTSRPFLKDGVLAYKKKWGGQIIADYNEPEFRFLICNTSLAVQRFFEDTPFICKNDTKLTSLVFLGQHVALDDKDLSSYIRACLFQGDDLDTCFILLNQDWVNRKETLKSILKGDKSTRIVDLSGMPLTALASLLYAQLNGLK